MAKKLKNLFLHTYVKNSKLKAAEIGGKWKVTQDNLQKFINGE